MGVLAILHLLFHNLHGHPLKKARWEKQGGITLVLYISTPWHILMKINRLTILGLLFLPVLSLPASPWPTARHSFFLSKGIFFLIFY